MTLLSRQALHTEINALLSPLSANRLRQVLVALAEEEHPRHRQAFLDRLRQHCKDGAAPGAPVSSQEALHTRLERVKAELYEIASSEHEYQWDWDEEESCGPFLPLMPELFSLLDEAADCLCQGEPQTARETYAAVWVMVDIENDYGHCPSLEEVDDALTREHAACYLRAVLLTTPPEEQVVALLQAAREVRFSGITSRPETLYCTLNEIAGAEPLPGWETFLDAVIQRLGNPQSLLEEMWLREALESRQGIDGMATMARQAGARIPRLWLDWVRTAVRQHDLDQAVGAWQEAQHHFPRGAGIWRSLADSIRAAISIQEIPHGDSIAFEALLANPSGHRLLTLYEACRDTETRHQRLRAAALWLGEAARTGKPPVPSGGANPSAHGATEALSEHDKDLVLPTLFQRWAPMAVLAWWLAGEGQQAKTLALSNETAVGLSADDSPRWALFACLPTVLAGRLVSAIGPATQATWQQLVLADRRYVGELFPVKAPSGQSGAKTIADRLNEALLAARQQSPPSPQEARCWLQWCCDTAAERCHTIVSNRHRKSYDRAAACVAVCVETATAMGWAPMGEALVSQLRQRFPRHTAFQRALNQQLRA